MNPDEEQVKAVAEIVAWARKTVGQPMESTEEWESMLSAHGRTALCMARLAMANTQATNEIARALIRLRSRVDELEASILLIANTKFPQPATPTTTEDP